MPATLADLEKQIAALKIALEGKRDKKTQNEEWAKTEKAIVEAEKKMNSQTQKLVDKITLEAKLKVLENRITVVEAMAKTALSQLK